MMRLQIDNQIKRLRAGLLLSASLLVSASALPPASDGKGFKAPLVMPSGEVRQMTGRLCRPAKPGPAPLVLLVHGTSPDPIRNAQKEMVHCTDPLAWWFTQQGYAFASFLRPGYGTSPGVVAELNSPPVTHEQASLARAATIPPALAVTMAQAFKSGGGQVELQQFPAFAAEGHVFIADPLGSAVWGPVVADYLARMGAEP